METIAAIVVGFVAGGVIVIGATVTGNQKELCDALGGQYRNVGTTGESCPGGSWANLVGARPKK